MTDDTEFITAGELANEAGVTKTYICRLCRTGAIEAKKFGNVWLISRKVGMRWLAERESSQQQPEEN
ncbi:MAG: helix-turn-helix domain-containing protein [Anaerolineae bacterium]|nr:helix-turn-helix domain-containing protein [Anaerolineae bacterium]